MEEVGISPPKLRSGERSMSRRGSKSSVSSRSSGAQSDATNIWAHVPLYARYTKAAALRRAEYFETHEDINRTRHELLGQRYKFVMPEEPDDRTRRHRALVAPVWSETHDEQRDLHAYPERCIERICGPAVSEYDRQFLPRQFAEAQEESGLVVQRL